MITFCFGAAGIVLILMATWRLVYRMPVDATVRQPRPLRHAERCGGSFDAVTVTPPLVQLFLYDSLIEIRVLGRVLVIPYQTISDVRIERLIVRRGVRVEHTATTADYHIMLFCRDNEAVLQHIQAGRRESALVE